MRLRSDLRWVLRTEELRRRPSGPPDHEAENRALLKMTRRLASDPASVLQEVVESVIEHGPGSSAGISILHESNEGEEVFRWEAIAGPFERCVGKLTPGDDSPCGVVVDRDAMLLFDRPGRHFPEFAETDPPIFETLTVPFHVSEEPVGTLWTLGHTPDCRFDAEDGRLLRDLASFASASYQLASSLEEARSARREAEAANRTKSDFIATVSHELRTPLNAIIGYTELLLEGVPTTLTEDVRSYVQRIARGAHHLRQLIEEVLRFSRLEAGREEIEEGDVSLEELVDEIRAVMEPLVRDQDLRLILDAERAPDVIRTDGRKLRQILMNLLGNAVKFTEEGMTALRIFQRSGRVLFQVSDTGPGIPAPDQQRLFESFWQAPDIRQRAGGGSGLGLTISQRYAEMLGGEITVESTPGEGSTFTLRLPRMEADGS